MQNRIADIDKRQLKKAPTANDIAWSLRKREILAMNKVRFATTQTGYHNIKRKHLIGFDRLASRLPSRGIGAQQNENDLINRVLFHTMSQNDLLANNKRELQKDTGVPRPYTTATVNSQGSRTETETFDGMVSPAQTKGAFNAPPNEDMPPANAQERRAQFERDAADFEPTRLSMGVAETKEEGSIMMAEVDDKSPQKAVLTTVDGQLESIRAQIKEEHLALTGKEFPANRLKKSYVRLEEQLGEIQKQARLKNSTASSPALTISENALQRRAASKLRKSKIAAQNSSPLKHPSPFK